jgi:hypothetical protein
MFFIVSCPDAKLLLNKYTEGLIPNAEILINTSGYDVGMFLEFGAIKLEVTIEKSCCNTLQE